MIRKMMIVLLGLALTFTFTLSGMAGEKGNKRKGKYSFRTTCRECHKPDASAKEMGPDSKTQAQWETVFNKEKGKYKELKCYKEGHWKDKKKNEALTEKDLLNIFTYLHAHAFDSPSPAKCK